MLALPAPAFGTVFHVTNRDDTEDGSLRKALADAAASNDPSDEIVFDKGGIGVITVHKPALALAEDDKLVGPDPVAGKPRVQLDAFDAGVQPGLSLAEGSQVFNVAVTGFGGSGIVIEATGDVLGSWVGVGLDGRCDGNDIGIEVQGDSAHIGNDVRSGNRIGCNLLGVDGAGTAEDVQLKGNTITG